MSEFDIKSEMTSEFNVKTESTSNINSKFGNTVRDDLLQKQIYQERARAIAREDELAALIGDDSERERAMAAEALLQEHIDESGHKISATLIDETLTINLLDANDNIISSAEAHIDENTNKYIVSGIYDAQTKSLIFTYNDEDTMTVDVSGLVNPLDSRLSAIEADYLTSTDKNALEREIGANTEAIDAAELSIIQLGSDISAVDAKVVKEVSDRQDADSVLQSGITKNADDISNEATARQNADISLQEAVNARALVQDLTNETTAREAADIQLQTNINAKQDIINSSNKLSADLVDDTNTTHKFATSEQLSQIATNTSAISSETERAEQAESSLDGRLDDIEEVIPSDATSSNKLATEKYVDDNGGKIDVIKKNGTALPIVDKTVEIEVPTKTSDLNNDSNYITNSTAQIDESQVTNLTTDLGNKLDKVQTTTSKDQAYVKNADGTQSNIDIATDDSANTIVKRDANKQINVAQTPTADSHATSKKYVDTQTSTVDNKLDYNVHIESGDEISYSGDTVTKTSGYRNLKTGATGTREEVIRLANGTNAGMMSPADYNQIRTNTSRIEQLEGQTRRLLYTASTNPTQQDIGTFVDNYLISIGITPSVEEYQGIAVVVAGTYHIWHYYDTQGVGWKDDGLDTVSQFTNETPDPENPGQFIGGIAGIIKGKQADGFVYAENDGTGSVYGWSQLKARVSNLETSAQTVSYDNTSGSEAFKQTINGTTTTLVSVSDLRTALNIPEDTGATSVEPTGSGNAFTGASYDAATRKITLVKGETFALDSNLYNYSTDIIIDEQTGAMSFAITSDVFNKLKTSRFATITLTNPIGAAYTFHKLGYANYDNVETLTFTTEVISGSNLTASIAFDGTDYTTLVEMTQVSADATGTTIDSYKRLDSIVVNNQTYDLSHTYQKAFTDGSATIASVSNNIVTLKAGVKQSDGSISNATGSDITLAKVAKTGSYNDLSDKPTIPTVPVQDVTVDGTSVLDGTTAKITLKTINNIAIPGSGNIDTPNDNYYQTPTFDNTNGALKIATGTGVNDLYVPQATTSQKGLVIVSTGLNINTDSSSANFGKLTLGSHASANTTYGVGSTTNYGHVKLATGDMNGAIHIDGVAVSKNHTHSQYVLTTRKVNGKALSSDITLSASDVSALPSNTAYVSTVNGNSGTITNVIQSDNDGNVNINTSLTTDGGYVKVFNDNNNSDTDAPRPQGKFSGHDTDLVIYDDGFSLFDNDTANSYQYALPAKSGTLGMEIEIVDLRNINS